jgi:RNA polymerase sigma-70 factor, ECF subfamily
MEPVAEPIVPISEVYARHRARALAIARRILSDSDEAEDVVQEVFLRLYLAPDLFDGRAAYSTWIFRVMVNSSINAMRSKRRRARLRSEADAPLTPEHFAVGREMHQRFCEALKDVSPQHQQVLWLREIRGYSYPEIAALLHIPEGTVKSAINRARQNILTLLHERNVLPREDLAA